KHYARVFDWRGIEHSKEKFAFSNDAEVFAGFLEWVSLILDRSGKETVILCIEPTGHYWFDFAKFLQGNGMRPVLVNPLHENAARSVMILRQVALPCDIISLGVEKSNQIYSH
ncbi:MAG: IS110 family transposase, partial [Ruminococcus sp.]|nr:IS110 family transposase [Ruminococcus sp.]